MKIIFVFLFGLIFLCLSTGISAQQYVNRYKDVEQKLLEATQEFDSVILVNHPHGLASYEGSTLYGFGIKNRDVFKIIVKLKFHYKAIKEKSTSNGQILKWKNYTLEKTSFENITKSELQVDSVRNAIKTIKFSLVEAINQDSLSQHYSNAADVPYYNLILLKSGKYCERGGVSDLCIAMGQKSFINAENIFAEMVDNILLRYFH